MQDAGKKQAKSIPPPVLQPEEKFHYLVLTDEHFLDLPVEAVLNPLDASSISRDFDLSIFLYRLESANRKDSENALNLPRDSLQYLMPISVRSVSLTESPATIFDGLKKERQFATLLLPVSVEVQMR
jgi:hypothetical protein